MPVDVAAQTGAALTVDLAAQPDQPVALKKDVRQLGQQLRHETINLVAS